MVDLTKHLARAKQALDRRGYDLALEQCYEMVDVAPSNLEVHKLLLDAAKRKAKEGGKKGLFGGLMGGLSGGISKDPHKQFVASVKKVGTAFDTRSLIDAADAALRLAATVKPMREVGILYYDEFHRTGMFNDKALWNMAHAYFEKHKELNDDPSLDRALALMRELEQAKPDHAEAAKMVKNWEAHKSMRFRQQKAAGGGGDYTGQVADKDKARRQEVMNRMIRTAEDAVEVIRYIDEDLAKTPGDKHLWTKKGDVLRRVNRNDEARVAYHKAQELDPHDFLVAIKLGDLRMEEAQARAAANPQDQAALQELLRIRMEEFKLRVERQPTDMSHRFGLGETLLRLGQVEGAAAEFQRTINDPRYRRASHRYLGFCFQKKNLLDLAAQHYNASLALFEDELSDEAKQVRYSLGRVFEDQGKKDLAVAQYEKLVSLDLGFRDAADRLSKLRGL